MNKVKKLRIEVKEEISNLDILHKQEELVILYLYEKKLFEIHIKSQLKKQRK